VTYVTYMTFRSTTQSRRKI